MELAQVKEEKQEERCTMDEKSKEAECWRYDEYLEEMHELQGQLKERDKKRVLYANSMLTTRNYVRIRSWRHRKPPTAKMDIVNEQ